MLRSQHRRKMNTLVEKAMQQRKTRHSVNLVEKINELIEIGGKNCQHIVSGGFTCYAQYDGNEECTKEANIVESDPNNNHVGCRDSASIHRITGGTFLVTWIVYQNGARRMYLTGVYMTPAADQNLVAAIINGGPRVDWKKL